jgi:hypothetical protein
VATAASFLGALALAAPVFLVGIALGFDPGTADDWRLDRPVQLAFEVAGMVIVAPLLETLILAAVVALLRRASTRLPWLLGASALLWGAAHALIAGTGLEAATRFVGAGWGFVIFTLAYLAWRPDGFRSAYWMAAAVHLLHNALVVTLALLALLAGGAGPVPF